MKTEGNETEILNPRLLRLEIGLPVMEGLETEIPKVERQGNGEVRLVSS